MIRAQLRGLHSPDTADLRTYIPQNPISFAILVQALIGPLHQPGEESFDFLVCSPEWVAQELVTDHFRFGTGLILMAAYSFPLLQGAITQLCERTSGETWESVALQLARFGSWEFEGYRPS